MIGIETWILIDPERGVLWYRSGRVAGNRTPYVFSKTPFSPFSVFSM